MPIHHEGSGFQWGNHGHVYPTREGAEKQAAAAHAHGYTGDATVKAAGVAFCTPAGMLLLLKRSDRQDHAGEWCLPGGTAENGERPIDTAQREVAEEIGDYPYDVDPPVLLGNHTSDEGVNFSTFVQRVPEAFDCELNDEHTEHGWFPVKELPQPLHPGVARVLPDLHESLFDCAMDVGEFKEGDHPRAENGEFGTGGGGAAPAAAKQPAQDTRWTIAFDRESVRHMDQDGRLHVAISNISKANVCEYYGAEIADGQALGLDPRKMYRLLRSPEALEAAVKSFNNIPILSRHVPVTADSPRPDLVIGATGTDAEFTFPYLRNSLVFWDGKAIESIESGACKELSCAYRYELDMTPGVFKGESYDGVMHSIRGNHVALVEEGRAGPDVMVGDSAIAKEKEEMTVKGKVLLSRRANLAKGALSAVLPSLIASDAKPKLASVLQGALVGVTANNWVASKPKIIAAVKPLLAKDASVGSLTKLLDGLDEDSASPDDMKMPGQTEVDESENAYKEGTGLTEDDDPCDEILEMLKPHVPPEVHTAVASKLQGMRPTGEHAEIAPASAPKPPAPKPAAAAPLDPNDSGTAMDNPPGGPGQPTPPVPEKSDMVTKPAMDAAIKAAVSAAAEQTRKATIAQMRAVADAEAFVMPYVGKLALQFDSAPQVYKAALDALGVVTEGVHESAYKPILENMPKPGTMQRVAQDARSAHASLPDDFATLFPDANRVRTI